MSTVQSNFFEDHFFLGGGPKETYEHQKKRTTGAERKEGSKEGNKEGRKAGRQEGRHEGRRMGTRKKNWKGRKQGRKK